MVALRDDDLEELTEEELQEGLEFGILQSQNPKEQVGYKEPEAAFARQQVRDGKSTTRGPNHKDKVNKGVNGGAIYLKDTRKVFEKKA